MESRGIELLPTSSSTGKREIVSFWARTVGLPLIFGLGLLFVTVFAFRAKLEFDLRSLANSVAEKEAVLAKSTEFEETFRQTQLQLETLSQVQQKLCYSCTVRKLNEIKPAEISFTSLSVEKEEAALTAETPPGASFGIFVANILEEPGIQSAAITSGSRNREGNFVFTMEMELDPKNLR